MNQTNDKISELRVIVVDDEEELRNILVKYLSRMGHDVRGVGDAVSLDRELEAYHPDVVILDLNLPGEDGISIAARLRRVSSCGIIMLTSRVEVDERVNGFESGADLYYCKPVVMDELHAGLLSLGRRILLYNQTATPKTGWKFDKSSYLLTTPNGISVELIEQEKAIMELLLATPGKTVPKSDLFAVLDFTESISARQRLEALISRLRMKVQRLDPNSGLPVRPRYRTGFAFMGELN